MGLPALIAKIRPGQFGDVAGRSLKSTGRLPIGVPQLLAHAVDDDVVPLSQTTRYAAAARAAGDDVSVLEFEVGGHFALIDPATPAWATVASALLGRL